MKRLWLGVLLVAAIETAALACSCVRPGTPAQSREMARHIVRDAVAIVEVDVLTGYRVGAGEQVRVRRVLWGRAPRDFAIARRARASSASCDLLLRPGQRKVLILYPAATGRGTGLAIQSLCSDYLVSSPGHLAVTLEEARRR